MNVATVKAPERVWFWRENAHLSVFLARRAAIGLGVYVYSSHAKIAQAEELWRYNVYFFAGTISFDGKRVTKVACLEEVSFPVKMFENCVDVWWNSGPGGGDVSRVVELDMLNNLVKTPVHPAWKK